jgi:TolA-binding protein
MTGSMPEVHADDLQVSEEEERYLRSAFRRFVVPYLLLVIAITTGAVMWTAMSPSSPVEDGSDELQSIVSEAASLREALALLRQEVRAQAAEEGDRLGQLEGGVERLRAGSGHESPAELADRLDHAHQRINALEGRLREMESRRVSTPAPAAPPASPAPASPAPWQPPASPTLP